MKKFILVGLILLTVSMVALSACDEVNTLKMNEDFASLKEKYLNNVVLSHITLNTWNSPFEVTPDAYVIFYSNLSMQKSGSITMAKQDELTDEDGLLLISAESLEEVVQEYFDVSTEHLRNSSYYRTDSSTYELWGMGGATDCEIINVEHINDLLVISFETFQDSVQINTCVLTVQLSDENSFRYLSCKTELLE